MLYREIIAVSCENHKKHIKALFWSERKILKSLRSGLLNSH